VGNEEGHAAETSWSTFTPIPLPGTEKPGPGSILSDNLPTGDRQGKQWTPVECDVPLRKGWFYHPDQDSQVKTPEKLFELYLKSVGRGASLDLGIAPDTRGRLHENDVASLKAFGNMLRLTFGNNLATSAKASKNIIDNDRYTHVKGKEFILEWTEEQEFNLIRLREDIRLGHRIDEWVAEVFTDGVWKEIARSTSVGNARILQVASSKARKLRIRVLRSSDEPAISEIGVFRKA
jgi:alpha-L-fucosidase